ncbi:putative Ig domain-containing protein [Undibacterium sp. Dicai25W]|uniref:putative Ig domain-containing protein n=1 Tax=Undibacterium sp. Dicai25W TaxID=3413034 RepID=UPI003BF28B45
MSIKQNVLFSSLPVTLSAPLARTLVSAGLFALLSACGSGTSSTNANSNSSVAQISTATTTLDLPVIGSAATPPDQIATPTFHIAPVLLNEPSDVDALDANSSAQIAANKQFVPTELQGLSSRRLTVDILNATRGGQNFSASNISADQSIQPKVNNAVVVTYTPAQIRAAYGLPALPANTTGLSAAQAAQLGAGQTIYLVDAQHDPYVVQELAAFNQKFGLPACTTQSIATNASLPLAPASITSGCVLSVVYNTSNGTMTSTAPAYDSGWATEITLDVQWAHATAPLARIVLIEAPDASLNSLIGGVKLANAMGPGVVSMSFGASEGNWTSSVDSAFTGVKMTYVAATGDSGAAVDWPAVSPNVLAVSGTSLAYSGSGSRSETVWSGTGGGISAYTSTPSYQTSGVPGVGSLPRRSVADVAFNADPSTGQYLAVINQGSSTVSWLSAGGTSLATPQWAGVITVANAIRAQNAKAALGLTQPVLYGQIAGVPGSYASAFYDVTSGSDGSCSTCNAKFGYDETTGLGTPNVTSLLTYLAGTSAASAPVVTGASISGQVGTALSFTVSASSPNPLTFSLSGAPSGMTINAAGIVTWATPVAGTYSVTVTAVDSKAKLSGSGVYTVKISPPVAPVVTGGAISGKVGTALSFNVSVTDVNPTTLTLSGAPSGMTISSTGVVSWATPVLGTYSVTVTATDSKNGLTGKGVYVVTIAAQPAPTVPGGSISGKAGTALSFSVTVANSNPLTYSLSGAPSGMTISAAGVVNWTNPVVGSYNVTVTAKDTKTGLSGQGVYTVVISAATPVGPIITAAPMTGVAGKPMSGTISFADAGATGLSVSISGVPLGMSFSMGSGMSLVASWPNPVTGSYTLKVTVTDNLGRSATASVPVTINAH